MKIKEIEPENPILLVDRDLYNSLKEKARQNEDEIKKQALEMANEYLLAEGVDFTIRINDERHIIKGHEILQIMDNKYSIFSSFDPISKQMKYNLVHDIVWQANKIFHPRKEEIIKFFRQYYKQDRLQFKKTIFRLRIMNFVLWLAFLGTLIYAIIR